MSPGGDQFGIPLSRTTIKDLRTLGISDWNGLVRLSDRDRLLLFGWGAVAERRFQQMREAIG